MLDTLRAKPVKENLIIDGIIELRKNQPILICEKNNSHKMCIYEEKEKESCLISSTFTDESCAMIGKEFHLNFLSDPKRVDISYYYFSVNGQARVYLYDMKKTFAGIDVLIKLIEQWKSSIIDAEFCVNKLDGYAISSCSDIHIGVITEENAVERRKRELQPILHPEPLADGIPEYLRKKRQASDAIRISQEKVLNGFDEGKVTICGITYEYDVRLFNDKKHEMLFVDGVLKK